MAYKLVIVAMGKRAVIHIVKHVPTVPAGTDWAASMGHQDEGGPSRPSRAATFRVCSAIMLGMPSCHHKVRGGGGDFPRFSVESRVSIHPQEYLCCLEALFDSHFLRVYALFQG